MTTSSSEVDSFVLSNAIAVRYLVNLPTDTRKTGSSGGLRTEAKRFGVYFLGVVLYCIVFAARTEP